MTIPEIATLLEKAPKADDVPFVMIEGWRLRDTDAALVEKGLIKPGAYSAAGMKRSSGSRPLLAVICLRINVDNRRVASGADPLAVIGTL